MGLRLSLSFFGWPEERRTQTVVDKPTEVVPVDRIVPTQVVEPKDQSRSRVPIVVTEHDGLYYVQDGNHRLKHQQLRQKYEVCKISIGVWILKDGDKSLVAAGDRTSKIHMWVKGDMSYKDLVTSAVKASEDAP